MVDPVGRLQDQEEGKPAGHQTPHQLAVDLGRREVHEAGEGETRAARLTGRGRGEGGVDVVGSKDGEGAAQEP